LGGPPAARAARAAPVNGILDSAVLIDILRSHAPALEWLGKQDQLGITSVSWLEIIEGAPDASAQRRAVGLLRRFERIDPSPQDFDWAIDHALRFRLSHNVDMMDCLIASTASRLSLPLFTRNLKHFMPLLGSLAQKPY